MDWLLTTITQGSANFSIDYTVDSSNGVASKQYWQVVFNIVADVFQTDQQIMNIDVDSGTTVFDFESDNEGFERATIQNADLNDYLSTQTGDAAKNSFYNALNFSSIVTATEGNGFWLKVLLGIVQLQIIQD